MNKRTPRYGPDPMRDWSERERQATIQFISFYSDFYRFAHTKLKADEERAKDLVQETFLKIINGVRKGKFEEIKNLKLYGFVTMRNLYFNQCRSLKTEEKYFNWIQGIRRDVEELSDIEKKILKDDVRFLLGKITLKERSIFLDAVKFKIPYKVIAEKYNTTESNIGTILTRAKRKLRDQAKLLYLD